MSATVLEPISACQNATHCSDDENTNISSSSSNSGISTQPDPAAKGQKEVVVDLRSNSITEVPDQRLKTNNHVMKVKTQSNGKKPKNVSSIRRTPVNVKIKEIDDNEKKLGKNKYSFLYALTRDGSTENEAETLCFTKEPDNTTMHWPIQAHLSESKVLPSGRNGGKLVAKNHLENSVNYPNPWFGSASEKSAVDCKTVCEQQQFIIGAPVEFCDLKLDKRQAYTEKGPNLSENEVPTGPLLSEIRSIIERGGLKHERMHYISGAETVNRLPDVDNIPSVTSMDSSFQETNDVFSQSNVVSDVSFRHDSSALLDLSAERKSRISSTEEKSEIKSNDVYSALKDKHFKGRLESLIAGSASSLNVISSMSRGRRDKMNDRALDVNFAEQNGFMPESRPTPRAMQETDIPKEANNETVLGRVPDKDGNLDRRKKRDRERKGFSYLPDQRQAEEMTKRAFDVSYRKPHKTVDRGKIGKAYDCEDSQNLKDFRKKLMKRKVRHEISSPDNEKDEPQLTQLSETVLPIRHTRNHSGYAEIIKKASYADTFGQNTSKAGTVRPVDEEFGATTVEINMIFPEWANFSSTTSPIKRNAPPYKGLVNFDLTRELVSPSTPHIYGVSPLGARKSICNTQLPQVYGKNVHYGHRELYEFAHSSAYDPNTVATRGSINASSGISFDASHNKQSALIGESIRSLRQLHNLMSCNARASARVHPDRESRSINEATHVATTSFNNVEHQSNSDMSRIERDIFQEPTHKLAFVPSSHVTCSNGSKDHSTHETSLEYHDDSSSNESISSNSRPTERGEIINAERQYKRRHRQQMQRRAKIPQSKLYRGLNHDATESNDRTKFKRPRYATLSTSRNGDLTIVTATRNINPKIRTSMVLCDIPQTSLISDEIQSFNSKAANVDNDKTVIGHIITARKSVEGGSCVTDLESHDYLRRLLHSRENRFRRPVARVRIDDSDNNNTVFSEPELDQNEILNSTEIEYLSGRFPGLNKAVNGMLNIGRMKRLSSAMESRETTFFSKIAEVNPRLHDVGKTGNIYRVEMKLNAIQSGRSTSITNSGNQYRSVPDIKKNNHRLAMINRLVHNQYGQRFLTDLDNYAGTNVLLHRTGTSETRGLKVPVSAEHYYELMSDAFSSDKTHDNFVIKSIWPSVALMEKNLTELSNGVETNLVDSDSVIKTFSDGMPRIRRVDNENEDTPLPATDDNGAVDVEGLERNMISKYNMTVNDTMTVAYRPAMTEEARRGREHKRGRRVDETIDSETSFHTAEHSHQYDNEMILTNQQRRLKQHQQHKEQKRHRNQGIPFNAEGRWREKNRMSTPDLQTNRNEADNKEGKETDDDDLQRYLSPPDSDEDEATTMRKKSVEFPKVVRGSILIRNSIDTTGGPRHLDVVAGDDPDGGGFIIEDNTNMFHRRYFQSRENPLYLSDPEYDDAVTPPQETDNGERISQFTEYDENSRSMKSLPIHLSKKQLYREFEINRDKHSIGLSNAVLEKNFRHKDGKPRPYEIWHLLNNAPADSIRQSINVQREEEEIIGGLLEKKESASELMLNVDMVSEKVDLGLKDGIAHVTVRVRCARIVPVLDSKDMFKKSSVVVTRIIEIDLTVSEERRRLYQRVLKNSSILTNTGHEQKLHATPGTQTESKLNIRDTFDLYKTLMAMADADETGHAHQHHLQIDQKLDEERMSYHNASSALTDDCNDDEVFGFIQPLKFDAEQLENRLDERIRPRNSNVLKQKMARREPSFRAEGLPTVEHSTGFLY